MRGGKKWRLAVLLTALLISFIWRMVARSEDATWDRLQRGEALRVAVDPSFPPFDFVDAKGDLAGFDIDLARNLGDRLHVPVNFTVIAFDGLADAVIANKADVVISAFPLDERLTDDVHYSQPYFEAGWVAVVGSGENACAVARWRQTAVAVEWGGRGDAWARAQALPRIMRMDAPEQALAAVQTRQERAAVVDAVTAAQLADAGLTICSPPLISDPYVIVMPKQAPKLAQTVDAALVAMQQQGDWQRIAAHYFTTPPPRP